MTAIITDKIIHKIPTALKCNDYNLFFCDDNNNSNNIVSQRLKKATDKANEKIASSPDDELFIHSDIRRREYQWTWNDRISFSCIDSWRVNTMETCSCAVKANRERIFHSSCVFFDCTLSLENQFLRWIWMCFILKSNMCSIELFLNLKVYASGIFWGLELSKYAVFIIRFFIVCYRNY